MKDRAKNTKFDDAAFILDLFNNKEIIFLEIKSRIKDIERYFFIKNEYKKKDILNNLKFQKIYKQFYGMNRFFTQEFFEEYFTMLSNKETNLRKILKNLYRIPRKKGDNTIQFSFATKLLHTVNNELPIYDLWIGKAFGLKIIGENKEDKINSCLLIYDKLKKYYKKLLSNEKTKKIISDFRESFNCNKKKISDIKILDFIIWANRKTK